MVEISPELIQNFPPNGPTDPIAYYRRPLAGWLFRERINIGLRMLGNRRFARGLEVGYGSGAVLAALERLVGELHGLDLDADPEQSHRVLSGLGVHASLEKGSVYEMPYPERFFDLAVSFSTFEHLEDFDRALSEVARVLRPGGLFLLGMPAVNKLMELGFLTLGFRGINDHHVTTPGQVAERFGANGLTVRDHARLTLPFPALPGVPVYFDWLLERT